MAPANPVPHDRSVKPSQILDPGAVEDDPAAHASGPAAPGPEPVSLAELNAWRRGLTPQAEIWNGRLAMIGLSMGLMVLIVSRLAGHHG